MPKAEMYRDRARRLRVMAHDTSPRIHRELLEISEQYERLADQTDMMRSGMWNAPPSAAGAATERATARETANRRSDQRANRR